MKKIVNKNKKNIVVLEKVKFENNEKELKSIPSMKK